MLKNLLMKIEPLSFPFKTPDPFLFCVYHKDQYPPGDAKMQAPKRGNGADFDPSAPYRMYHGDRIPGFPQHPHRGFETITATITGIIDHTDSKGNAGRYGQGDLQWMTAGNGIVHGEMFPLVNQDKPNPTRFFQIWLNLPSKSKMVEPDFVMHWAEDIKKLRYDDDRVQVTLWHGELDNVKSLDPPINSWATKDDSDVMILHIILHPKAEYTLPKAKIGKAANRMIYFIEGSVLSIGEHSLDSHSCLTVDPSQDLPLMNTSHDITEILVLQGKPINEPVAQHGPFVMNTETEIRQAFADYRSTQFGGWPWPEDAIVFPREKGRFALTNDKEIYPPS
jgi:quercetin 2,3-dioxygenase